MNPRTVFMKYLGWCPGVAAAAKFVPDRDISLKIMAVSGTVLLLAFIVFVYVGYSKWIPVNEEGPIGELPVEWVRYFGGSENDRGEYILITRDGGYLIVGYRNIPRAFAFIYLSKVNSNGTLQWDRTYGYTGWDSARSAIEVEDGYVIIGCVNGSLLLMKTDFQGETMWSRTCGSGAGFSVKEAVDGGYDVVGMSTDGVLLLRTDKEGEILWRKTYVVAGQVGQALKVTRDGGYLIGTRAFTLLKMDPRGEVIWSRTLVGSKAEWLYDVIETPEDGVLAVGFIVSAGSYGGAGGSKTWVVKLDKNGEILWSKTYPGSGGYDAQLSSDGKYVILSSTLDRGGVLLTKIDRDGNLEWSKAYGDLLYLVGSFFQVTNDGGYIVTGYQDIVLDNNVILVKIPPLEE